MKWLFFASFILVLQSHSCKKQADARIPACIEEKIDAISQQARFNPPATVYRYLYKDQYVYLFSSDCCDQYNYLYDKNCKIICAPSGGIGGAGDGRCSNFFQMVSDKTLIWKDPR